MGFCDVMWWWTHVRQPCPGWWREARGRRSRKKELVGWREERVEGVDRYARRVEQMLEKEEGRRDNTDCRSRDGCDEAD